MRDMSKSDVNCRATEVDIVQYGPKSDCEAQSASYVTVDNMVVVVSRNVCTLYIPYRLVTFG